MNIKPMGAKVIQNIKKSVKNEGLGINFNVPKQFIEKRNYMQSDEFLNDPHNVKMFEYGERLAVLREKIAKEIVERNKTSKDELVQGINGFSRVKKYLDINPKLNHIEEPSFHTPLEAQYWMLRTFGIRNAVRVAKNKLNELA